MKRIWGAVLGALLAVAVPAAAQNDEAAELVEARAIVAVMFPPTERDQMFRTMIEQLIGQMEQAAPFDITSIGDPALTKMVAQFRDSMMESVMPIVQAHLPRILDASAVSYTHEFDLAELRDIRAFAETPAGRHYLSRSTALLGDPAVAEANTAYMREIQALAAVRQGDFREEVRDYFEAHPEVARKVAEATRVW
jgi:hypothetical protein